MVGGVGSGLRGGPRRPRSSVDEQHHVACGGEYILMLAASALVLSVLVRHAVTSVMTVAVLAATLGVQIRWYYAGQPHSTVCDAVEVRMLSLNFREGRADMAPFADLARTSAEVITLSEIPSDWVQRFYAAGMRHDFPYSVMVPRPGAGGYGL